MKKYFSVAAICAAAIGAAALCHHFAEESAPPVQKSSQPAVRVPQDARIEKLVQ